jgi:hypothetical protein
MRDYAGFHFASMTRLPALGIFHHHYPTCVTLPRDPNLHMARAARELNASRRRDWNIVEYAHHLTCLALGRSPRMPFACVEAPGCAAESKLSDRSIVPARSITGVRLIV